jgi:hypothetical protein
MYLILYLKCVSPNILEIPKISNMPFLLRVLRLPFDLSEFEPAGNNYSKNNIDFI